MQNTLLPEDVPLDRFEGLSNVNEQISRMGPTSPP